MNKKKIKILGICGSLRQASSAHGVLKIVSGLLPADAELIIYKGLETIPPFNDSSEIPQPVSEFIRFITEADGVFICSPEYAFGVSGVLKNALDWTVSSIAFSDKPVALITAASSGEKAHTALLLTLSAIGTKMTDRTNLLISFIRSKLDEKGEIKDTATLESVKSLVNSFISDLRLQSSD